jgi:hypothetical protein
MLTIDLDWALTDAVGVDGSGRLRFPVVPAGPGLYRFWIESGDERPTVYLGEASDLRRRLQSYRTPGARQATNQRVGLALLAAIKGGGRVTLWLATDVSVAFGPAPAAPLDLSRKNLRLVAEQAAIAEALLHEDLADTDGTPRAAPMLLNRPGKGEAPYEHSARHGRESTTNHPVHVLRRDF